MFSLRGLGNTKVPSSQGERACTSMREEEAKGPEPRGGPDASLIEMSFSRVLFKSVLGFHVPLSALCGQSPLATASAGALDTRSGPSTGTGLREVLEPGWSTRLYSGVKGKRPGSGDAMMSRIRQGPGLMELADPNGTHTHSTVPNCLRATKL